MPNLSGHTIGQYRIIEQIGRGGMATVYKAFQSSMERYVAIKVLPEQLAEDPHFIERFRQEAKAIAQLEHPHILPVYDYGEEKGLTYMVMRYMDSGTLTARLRKQPGVAEVVRLLGQVAEALDYTHSRGIVHRDIKPANILIDSRGETLLTDFGIAKIVEGTQGLTQGGIVGTPAYMSPEQAQGLPVDGRSDIYSLGIILYEALAGRPPFEAETPVAVLMKHVNAPLPLPRTVKPDISEAMEQVILKALAKEPVNRYQTAGEMKRAMETALVAAGQGITQFSYKTAQNTAAAPPVTLPSTPKPIEPGQTNRLPLMIGGGVLVILLAAILGGGFFFSGFQNQAGTPARTEAAFAPTADSPQATSTPTIRTSLTPPAKPTATPTTPSKAATSTAISTPTNLPSPTSTPVEPSATPLAAATIAPVLPPTPTPAATLAAFNITGNPGNSKNPELAVDEAGNLHLVWWDDTARVSAGQRGSDLFHRIRTPNGDWSEAVILTENFEGPRDTDSPILLRRPSGQLCVFWQGFSDMQDPSTVGLYTRCYENNSWSNAERVVNYQITATYAPAFALAGEIKVAYDVPPKDVFFEEQKLSDGFATVDDTRLVIDTAGVYHLVWKRQGDPYSVEYSFSSDGGQNWSKVEPLTSPEAKQVFTPRLLADAEGNVHLTWAEFGGRNFYRRRSPEGEWSEQVELNPAITGGAFYNLAVDNEGLAHLAIQWSDLIYIRQQPDGSWLQPQVVLKKFTNLPIVPALAIDTKGTAHFAWENKKDIYYASLSQ